MNRHDHQHSAGLFRRAATLAVAGLLLGVAAAAFLQPALAVDDGYPARTGLVGAAVFAVALAGLCGGHPFARLGPANILTGARAMVMALVAGASLAPDAPPPTWPLLILAATGALADLFDGRLARRSGLASRFGARFDMEVDALLILALSILAWRTAGVGPWIVASGLLRYAFIAAGWIWPWLAADLPPSRRRQTMCVVQIVALIAALVPGLRPAAASLVSGAGLALLVWSFAADVHWLHARRHMALAVR